MTIKEFISERLKLTLDQMGIEEITALEFVIFFELNSEKESQSSQEDMANWWSLPYSVNRRLTFDEVIDKIQFFDSIAPLWVKVSEINKILIGLEISQKLRKKSEILDHHNDSDIAPFLIEKEYLSFTEDDERLGLIDYLTLTLRSTPELVEFFSDQPPTVEEVFNCIKKNFQDNYLFFPNNYSDRKTDETGYSDLFIQRNLKDESYQLMNQNDQVIKKSKNLDELIEDYIVQELKYKVGEIEIIK